jgi:hypothetical protein
MQLLPHRFSDQTDQSIRNRIRKNYPIDPNAEVKTKTGEDNWLSHESKIPYDWFGGNYRTWERRRGVQRPTNRNQKAHARPDSNSEFHGGLPMSTFYAFSVF